MNVTAKEALILTDLRKDTYLKKNILRYREDNVAVVYFYLNVTKKKIEIQKTRICVNTFIETL